VDEIVIRFREVRSDLIPSGRVLYSESEYGFRFEVDAPMDLSHLGGNMGSGSLSLGTLQIAVGVENGIVLYPWGYHPHLRWDEADLQSPISRSGLLQVLSDSTNPIASGVAIPLPRIGMWQTQYDKRAELLRVSDTLSKDGLDYVEFSSGSTAGLEDGYIRELWLRFEWEP
jgi:hypothetical protein